MNLWKLSNQNAATSKSLIEENYASAIASNGDNAYIQFEGAPPNTNPLWEDLVQSGRQDFIPADTFVNAALMVSSEQSPKKLICSLKRIEKSTGRYVYQKNSSRTCDIDILLSKPDGKHVIENGKYNLIIPHPKICDRKFVLKPLNDICPNWQHFDYKQNILSLNRDSKIKDNIYRLRQTL